MLLNSDRIPMGDAGQVRVGCVRLLLRFFACSYLTIAGSSAAADVPAGSLQKGIQLIQHGDWAQAEQAINQALVEAPGDIAAVYWKSYVLFHNGIYKESAAYAANFLEHKPDSGDAHKILGLDYFMQGQAALAETELNRAAELLPADADARYYLGRVQFERHNLPAALESLRKVVALDPISVRGFNQLGQTHEGLAQFDAARAAYKKAIALEKEQLKKSEWPYFNLGVLALKEGREAEAIGWLREALLRRPTWPEAKVKLASALSTANQFEEARRLLEEVLATEPKNSDAHYQLGRLLIKLRQPDEARRHLLLFSELKDR